MQRNVGSTERYVRVATGVAIAAAAAKTHGWRRATLGAVGAAEVATAILRYCPVNQAIGRNSYRDDSRLAQGQRDGEIRRETAIRGSLGTSPSGVEARVTRESDVFGHG